MAWIELRTCMMVEVGIQPSERVVPLQVPSKLRQTLPSLYKFGLKRTCPYPVVIRLTFGGQLGYSSGIKMSYTKHPFA